MDHSICQLHMAIFIGFTLAKYFIVKTKLYFHPTQIQLNMKVAIRTAGRYLPMIMIV